MGLDMYLEHKISRMYTGIDGRRRTDIESVEIGYWRKFNALHDYIVSNFSNGKDDCRPIGLGSGAVAQILEVLEKVNKDNSKAEELLPTASGFFFGSTEYDEWYFKDVERSIEIFREAREILELDNPPLKGTEEIMSGNNPWCFREVIYQASW